MFNKFIQNNKQSNNILELNDLKNNIEKVSINKQKVQQLIKDNQLEVVESQVINYQTAKQLLDITDVQLQDLLWFNYNEIIDTQKQGIDKELLEKIKTVLYSEQKQLIQWIKPDQQVQTSIAKLQMAGGNIFGLGKESQLLMSELNQGYVNHKLFLAKGQKDAELDQLKDLSINDFSKIMASQYTEYYDGNNNYIKQNIKKWCSYQCNLDFQDMSQLQSTQNIQICKILEYINALIQFDAKIFVEAGGKPLQLSEQFGFTQEYEAMSKAQNKKVDSRKLVLQLDLFKLYNKLQVLLTNKQIMTDKQQTESQEYLQCVNDIDNAQKEHLNIILLDESDLQKPFKLHQTHFSTPNMIKKLLQFQSTHVVVGLTPVAYKKQGKSIEIFSKLQINQIFITQNQQGGFNKKQNKGFSLPTELCTIDE